MKINFENITTKELVSIWNCYQNLHQGKQIKKFADRKTAEKRISNLLEGLTVADYDSMIKDFFDEKTYEKLALAVVLNKLKVVREDGKYQRTNPTFETEKERAVYVSTQYATKTDRFPGRRSKFADCTLELTREIVCPFREGTVVENSFQIIACNPGISYERFRIDGGRNTDLQAMVDRKIVKVKKLKRKQNAKVRA